MDEMALRSQIFVDKSGLIEKTNCISGMTIKPVSYTHLVIPDVHLKPQMFKQATALMHQGIADRAVCLVAVSYTHIESDE